MPHLNYFATALGTFLLISVSSLAVKAQDTVKPASEGRNSINVYVGMIEYNINYERNIIQRPNSHSNLRIGYGHAQFFTAGEGNYLNPAFVHLMGKKNSFFEINAGIKYMITNSISDPTFLETFVPNIFLGFRYEKPVRGIIFRFGFSYPTIINIGFGYKF
jgi:hypothetical protein